MGRLTNLNPPTPIAEADLPQSIALDTELAAAFAAHIEALNPHLQYLRIQKAAKSIAGPVTFAANTWASLGTFSNFSLVSQNDSSPTWVGIRIIFDTAAHWQEARCGAWLNPVWWQPIPTYLDPNTRVFLEYHNGNGFYVYIRPGKFSDASRSVEFFPETGLTVPNVGRIDVTAVRLLLPP